VSIGRPSSFSEQIADEICSRLIEGESLRSICLDERLPSAGTVCRWLADDRYATFREQYARARDIQLDVLADEIIHIANTQEIGEIITEKPTGTEIKRADMIEHRRLKIDARKWYAGKLAPKKYGDRQHVEHTGAEGGPIQTIDLSKMSTADLETLERIVSSAKPAAD
jgi:hypothetical protein